MPSALPYPTPIWSVLMHTPPQQIYQCPSMHTCVPDIHPYHSKQARSQGGGGGGEKRNGNDDDNDTSLAIINAWEVHFGEAPSLVWWGPWLWHGRLCAHWCTNQKLDDVYMRVSECGTSFLPPATFILLLAHISSFSLFPHPPLPLESHLHLTTNLLVLLLTPGSMQYVCSSKLSVSCNGPPSHPSSNENSLPWVKEYSLYATWEKW